MGYKIILFYQYIQIDNPEALRKSQLKLCQSLNLKGRVILAKEGINGTLEGIKGSINNYKLQITKDRRFKDIHFKISEGTGSAFSKLSIKIKDEIVASSLGKDNIDPNKVSGKYLSAEALHKWFEQGKDFVMVDMRNNFEQEVGFFERSILSGVDNFSKLPKILPKLKKIPPRMPIVTYCTGGVRCEKASGFLINKGFKNVYQLFGGIHTYIEKYPNQHFKGSLYVFDARLVMGFNLDDPKREIVGRCAKCGKPSEHFINCQNGFCNRHFIVCDACLDGQEKILCPTGCRDYSKEHPETARAYLDLF